MSNVYWSTLLVDEGSVNRQEVPCETRPNLSGTGADELLPFGNTLGLRCLQCRRDLHKTSPEPLPGYMRPMERYGVLILSWISEEDAKRQYSLDELDVQELEPNIALDNASGIDGTVQVVSEAQVLLVARSKWGGDCGIRRLQQCKHYNPLYENDRTRIVRSLLCDRGIYLPPHFALNDAYIGGGIGHPMDAVRRIVCFVRKHHGLSVPHVE